MHFPQIYYFSRSLSAKEARIISVQYNKISIRHQHRHKAKAFITSQTSGHLSLIGTPWSTYRWDKHTLYIWNIWWNFNVYHSATIFRLEEKKKCPILNKIMNCTTVLNSVLYIHWAVLLLWHCYCLHDCYKQFSEDAITLCSLTMTL